MVAVVDEPFFIVSWAPQNCAPAGTLPDVLIDQVVVWPPSICVWAPDCPLYKT